MRKEVQPHGGALVRPEKGQTANPNGRPRKLVTNVLNELRQQGYERVGAGQVREALEVLINLPKDELLEIAEGDKGHPMLVVIAARGLCSKKGWEVLSDLLDRAHGKAKQKLEHTGLPPTPPPSVTVQVLPPPFEQGNGG